jgi:hypothetical protein
MERINKKEKRKGEKERERESSFYLERNKNWRR